MKYPLIAIPLSTLLILTGCGGSSSGGDDAAVVTPPPPPPAATKPVVTVTAPAKVFVNIPFDVQWTSTDATACASEFTNSTATSGTASITLASDEPAEVTYEVTCTGAGGSSEPGIATVSVGIAATAEGLWQGTMEEGSDSRALSGVVTKENTYWLVYNSTTVTGQPAGFFTGSGTSVSNTDGISGTFPSSDLREFNFESQGNSGGNLSGTYIGKAQPDAAFNGSVTTTSLSAPYSFAGQQTDYTIDGVTDSTDLPGLGATITSNPTPATFADGGTPWNIKPSGYFPDAPPEIGGALTFPNYSIILDMPFVSATVTVDYTNRKLIVARGPGYQVTWDATSRTLKATGVRFVDTSTSTICSDPGAPSPGDYCAFLPSSQPFGDITITYSDNTLLSYHGVIHTFQPLDVPNFFVPIPSQTCYRDNPTHSADENATDKNPCANLTLEFDGTVPPSTTRNFATTFKSEYDLAPALTDISGSYSGSDGVDITLNTGGTLDVALDGTVSATVANGTCAVTGTVVTHIAGGNVYDATLQFADGSGTCAYSGAFAGAATYDVTDPDHPKISITAIEVVTPPLLPSKGFLFVGTEVN